MTDDRIAKAAALFAKAWRNGTSIEAFPDDLVPRDLAEATAMQDEMAARIGEDVVGWKIAGRPGAPMGRIFASTSFDNGATLPLPRYARNIVECEVGFRLRIDLPPRAQPYEREEVAAATDLAINIELVGSRRANVLEPAAAAAPARPPLPGAQAATPAARGGPMPSNGRRRRSPPVGPSRPTTQRGCSSSPTTPGTSASSPVPSSRIGSTVRCSTSPSSCASTVGRAGRCSRGNAGRNRSTCCSGRRTTCPGAASG